MRTLLFLVCFCLSSKAEDIPTLRFDKEITWNQVFDSGFRPKYFDTDERATCICMDQVFWLQFQDRQPKFKLEKGRVMFAFPIEHDIHMLWHQGLDPITLEEGKRRADLFREIFDGYIIQEITMPRIIDPSGLVDANNDENNIKARIGNYLIFYGFDNSFGTAKPIIPHFYIALSYPGKPDYRIKPMDYKIKPPVGYEWYSLDPKVNTPDPADLSKAKPIVPEKIIEKKPEAIVIKEPVSEPPKTTPPQVIKSQLQEQSWLWLVGLIALLSVIGFSVKRFMAARS
jgi:hypothetical protein